MIQAVLNSLIGFPCQQESTINKVLERQVVDFFKGILHLDSSENQVYNNSVCVNPQLGVVLSHHVIMFLFQTLNEKQIFRFYTFQQVRYLSKDEYTVDTCIYFFSLILMFVHICKICFFVTSCVIQVTKNSGGTCSLLVKHTHHRESVRN